MSIYIQDYLEHLELYMVLIEDYHYQVQAYMTKSELEDLPAVINPESLK